MDQNAERFMKLQEEAEDLKTRKIRLEEQCKAKEQELRALIEEIKAEGYDPKQLKKTIEEMEKQLDKDIAEFETGLQEASKELSAIEEG